MLGAVSLEAKRVRWARASLRPGPYAVAVPEGLPLTALVVGTDDWAIEQGAEALEGAGHDVLRCHEPGEPAFPCNALREDRTCPLDVGFDVVVTMRARPLTPPTGAEFGVICALHGGAPLVVAGMSAKNPLEPWAVRIVAPQGDIVSACESAVGDRRAGSQLENREGDAG